MSQANSVFVASLLVIALGYLLKRLKVFRLEDGQTLARVVLTITLPAVALETLPGIALDASLILFPLVCLAHSAIVLLAGHFLFRRREDRTRAVLLMATLGFNNGLFAFPIVQALWGARGLQYLVMFDIGNALILLGVNYLIASWFGTRAAGGTPALTPRFVLLNLAKSVPLVCYALALLMNVTGLRFPPLVGSLIGVLARANMPLVLLLLGIFMDFGVSRQEVGQLLWAAALRYGSGLLTGGLLFFLLPYDAEYRKIMLVALLLPVGATVGAFSAAFRLNRALASLCTNATLIVSFALMWVVANVL